MKGVGVPAGPPSAPNTARFYLDTVDPANLLRSMPVLPTGRVEAGVTLPPDTSPGEHVVVSQVVNDGILVHERQIPLEVTVLPMLMQLWVDDAWMRDPAYDMPIVNKLVPEAASSLGQTKVDVTCRFLPSTLYEKNSVKFQIQVEGNRFGAPEAVFVRLGYGGLHR
jgi:hypothetical protein